MEQSNIPLWDSPSLFTAPWLEVGVLDSPSPQADWGEGESPPPQAEWGDGDTPGAQAACRDDPADAPGATWTTEGPDSCDQADASRPGSLAHDAAPSLELASSLKASSNPSGLLLSPPTCDPSGLLLSPPTCDPNGLLLSPPTCDQNEDALERHLLNLQNAIFEECIQDFALDGLDGGYPGWDSMDGQEFLLSSLPGVAFLNNHTCEAAEAAETEGGAEQNSPGQMACTEASESKSREEEEASPTAAVAQAGDRLPAAGTAEGLWENEGCAHGDVAPRDESPAEECAALPPVRGTLMTPLASRLAAVLKCLEHPNNNNRGGPRRASLPPHVDESAAVDEPAAADDSAAAAESARGASTAGRVGAAQMPSGSHPQPGRQSSGHGSSVGNVVHLRQMESDTTVVSESRKEAESAESAAASAPSGKTQADQDTCFLSPQGAPESLPEADFGIPRDRFQEFGSLSQAEAGEGRKKQRTAAQGAMPCHQSGTSHGQFVPLGCMARPAVGAGWALGSTSHGQHVREQKACAAPRLPAGASLVPAVAGSDSWRLEHLAPGVLHVQRTVALDTAGGAQALAPGWAQDQSGVRVQRPFPLNKTSAWGQDQSRFTDSRFQKRVMSRLMTLATAYSTCQQEAAQKHLLWLRQLASPRGASIQRLVHYLVSGLLVRFEGAGSATSPNFSSDHAQDGALVHSNAIIRRLWGNFPEALFTQSFISALQGKTNIHIILLTQSTCPDWQELFTKISLGSHPGQPKVRVSIVVPCIVASGSTALQSQYLPLGESIVAAARTAGVHATWSLTFVVPAEFNPSMVHVAPGETVAVAAWLSMETLPDETVLRHNPRQQCLQWIKSLAPAVVTIIDLDTDYNSPFFLSRFRDVLRGAKALLDNLEHTVYCHSTPESRAADLCLETFLAFDLQNCVACDGLARIPRAEPMSKWRDRMLSLGFREMPLGDGVFEALRAAPSRHRRLWVEDVGGFASLRWDGTPLLFGGSWC